VDGGAGTLSPSTPVRGADAVARAVALLAEVRLVTLPAGRSARRP
jgi:hypothetical protein